MTHAPTPRFASVVLDVDSTLCGLEGIDWLAAQRTPDVADRIAELTDRAMAGDVPLDAVYGERLTIVRPERDDLAALAAAYVGALAPGAAASVRRLREAGVRVAIVSGGLREAILPLAAHLGVAPDDVRAVGLRLDDAGGYAGHDESSPLATADGKRGVIAALALPRPTLHVGDGATDLAARPAVDAFAAYVGFVRRAPVVAAADHVLADFAQLTELVLG